MFNNKKDDNIQLLPSDSKNPKLYSEENNQQIKLIIEGNGEQIKVHGEEADPAEPRYQLEDIIQSLGGCGRYQIRLAVLMRLMMLPSCWCIFVVIFTNITPRWTCADDLVEDTNTTATDLNITWHQNCTNKHGSKCSKFLFDTSQYNTFINQWNLICDRDWIPYTIVSMQLVGVVVGNMVGGIMADWIGRKKPLYLSCLILAVGNGWAFLSTSWVEMTVIRFFMGIGAGFYLAVNNIIVSEITLSRWRALAFAIPAWSMHEWLFAGLAWLVPDWAYLHLIMMLVILPYFATWCFVKESIRWLMVKDKIEEADAVIYEIADINKYPYPGSDMVMGVTDRIKPISETADKKEDVSVLNILKKKDLLKITVCLLINWFTMGLGMHAILFAISAMSGNKYVNMFMFSITAVMSQIVTSVISHRIGRRTSIVFFFSTATLGCLGATIARLTVSGGYTHYIYITFAVIAYASLVAVWIAMIIITMELYPTIIRNRAFGFLNMLSRIGGVLSPQLSLLEIRVPGMLYIICGGLCLIATMTAIALPETKDVALKDQMHDETQAEFTRDNSGNKID